jgi:inosine/guanosine/xanthosine phosphorylase family protein
MASAFQAFAALAAAARVERPEAALILGSGIGNAASRLQPAHQLHFSEVPGMASTTVPGHAGRITLGSWAGRRVLAFEGRLHRYEGHPWPAVLMPVQTAAELGAPLLVLTNAAGGIHEALGPGSFMVICNHIDWTRPYGWRGPRPSPYSPRFTQVLSAAVRPEGGDVMEGSYAAVTGPCYETPAEIRALRSCGAHAVGMSTAREAEAGHELGMEVCALSYITNRAAGLADRPLSHEEVLAGAASQAEQLAKLLERFLGAIPSR